MNSLYLSFDPDLLQKAAATVKTGGDAELSYAMTGRLYASQSGWLLLSVPNALVRGVFDTIQEPGVELPPGKNGNPFNAHISVMRSEEVESIGGVDKITERGHTFRYTLGPLKTVVPAGWDAISKVWFVQVNSPELKKLRTSYGLTPLPHNNEFDFHITAAVRKKSVLQHNDVAKAANSRTYYHGSPTGNLTELNAGSWVTPDLETAQLMGRFFPASGKTWSDDDLAEPHQFGKPAHWKDGREPTGVPHIYQVTAAQDQLDQLNNPYEHRLLANMPASPYVKTAAADALPPESESIKGHGTIMGRCGHKIRSCRCCEASKVYQSEDYCHECRDKLASIVGPVMQQAFHQTPIRYDFDQNVLQNAMHHLQSVQSRGQHIVNDSQSLERMRTQLDPQYGIQQFMKTLNGQPEDPRVSPGVADRAMLNFPTSGL